MQFCTNCGASIEQPSASAVQAKTGAKKKGVVITLCIVLALAVIGAGVFFVLRLLKPREPSHVSAGIRRLHQGFVYL